MSLDGLATLNIWTAVARRFWKNVILLTCRFFCWLADDRPFGLSGSFRGKKAVQRLPETGYMSDYAL
jgi:hypothetical protein